MSIKIDPVLLREAKRDGFSDKQIATIFSVSEVEIRNYRKSQNIEAVFKTVDTCAAEPRSPSTENGPDYTPRTRRRVLLRTLACAARMVGTASDLHLLGPRPRRLLPHEST